MYTDTMVDVLLGRLSGNVSQMPKIVDVDPKQVQIEVCHWSRISNNAKIRRPLRTPSAPSPAAPAET
eukprot:SAG31_NODE_45434_length_259_cov_0.506250_1_plen_66_part_01